MAASWMEFPKTTSGAVTPALIRDWALPSSVGTSSSLLVMVPPTTRARAEIGQFVTRIEHTYRNGGVVELEFFEVHAYDGDIENRIFNQIRWERLENLPKYDFLAADHGLVRDLAAGKLLNGWKSAALAPE